MSPVFKQCKYIFAGREKYITSLDYFLNSLR